MFYLWRLYLLTYTDVRHDFHIRWCSVSLNSKTTGVTSGAGTVCPPRAPEFIQVLLWGRVAQILFFTLSVLRFMAFVYTFGILKTFLKAGCAYDSSLSGVGVVPRHGEIRPYLNIHGFSRNFGIYVSQMTTDMFTHLYRTFGTLIYLKRQTNLLP
jgi:hypothetical protein